MALPKYDHIPLNQYLSLEQEDRTRYDYINGYLYEMSGGSLRHETICGNVQGYLFSKLKANGAGCRPYGAGLKIELRVGTRFVYPDGTVFCGELEESPALMSAARSPLVVIEVLSKSTFAYDLGFKARQYRKMPSIREIIFLAQTRPRAEVHHRDDKHSLFQISDLEGMSSVLDLRSIGVSLPFSEIYEDVTFIAEEAEKQLRYDPIKPYEQPAE